MNCRVEINHTKILQVRMKKSKDQEPKVNKTKGQGVKLKNMKVLRVEVKIRIATQTVSPGTSRKANLIMNLK